MLSFFLYHQNPLVYHLSRKGPGFQPILYKFIIWALLGLSLYLCYARNSNYDLTDTIYRSYCITSANFYLYQHYFQQKVFSFSKISKSQTDPKTKISGRSFFIFKYLLNNMYWIFYFSFKIYLKNTNYLNYLTYIGKKKRVQIR